MKIRKLRTLRPHQLKVEKYLNTQQHPAIIVRMRLGKTLCVIRWTKRVNAINILVICPLAVTPVWEEDLTKEGEWYLPFWGKTPKAKEQILEGNWDTPRRKWYITNLEGLRSSPGLIFVPFDVVILDEGKTIANPRAQVTKLVTRGFREVKHRCLLTGALTPETPLETFTQFQFLDGEFLGYRDFYEFRYELFKKDWSGYRWTPKPGVRTRIKEAVHARACVMTERDAGIKPNWTNLTHKLEMNTEQRRIYNEVEKEFATKIPEGKGHLAFSTKWAPVQYIWLRRICGGFAPDGTTIISRVKFDYFLKLIKDELIDDKPLIWFAFVAELKYMAKLLEEEGIGCVQIHGQMKQALRKASLNQWRENSSIPICLASISCIKYGLDCSVTDTELYYSNQPSYTLRSQSKKRIQNPFKKQDLLCLDVVMRNSVDEDMLKAIKGKGFQESSMMVLLYQRFKERVLDGNSRLSSKSVLNSIRKR